jgi:hypothetical protein
MENIKQNLLEFMADFLDNSNTYVEMQYLGLKDNEDLHIKMCEAAFKVFEEETKP